MVPFGEAVELLVRQEMVLQETGGEGRVGEPRGHGDQWDQWCAEMLDAVEILLDSLCCGGRCRGACHADVVFGRWVCDGLRAKVPALEVFADR